MLLLKLFLLSKLALASPLTTKGDVYTRSGSADARQAVGTNNQVLISDSTQSNGLNYSANTSLPYTWANVSSGAVSDSSTITTALNLKQPLIMLNVNTTTAGNVGTGEDDLISYTIPAAKLAVNGRLKIIAFGEFSAEMGAKNVRCYFGATELVNTFGYGPQDGSWVFNSTIVATGAATQRAMSNIDIIGSAINENFPNYTTPTETLSGTIVVKCTGETTNDNDITQTGLIVDFSN